MEKVSVIIAAAGNAERMNGINKQLAMLKGKPVIAYSMLAFQQLEEVHEIIASVRECDFDIIANIAMGNGISKFAGCAVGGATRQQSVINALKLVSRESSMIAVHDAARPLVDPENIKRCIKDASVFGGAVLGVPVKDTIKVVDDGLITDTPDRRRLYMTQTPQIFKKSVFYEGVNFAKEHELDFTDDCQMAEAVGVKVFMTLSDYKNIKITTPEDMAIAEAIMGK